MDSKLYDMKGFFSLDKKVGVSLVYGMMWIKGQVEKSLVTVSTCMVERTMPQGQPSL